MTDLSHSLATPEIRRLAAIEQNVIDRCKCSFPESHERKRDLLLQAAVVIEGAQAVSDGIWTDAHQQFEIVGDHFALRAQDLAASFDNLHSVLQPDPATKEKP